MLIFYTRKVNDSKDPRMTIYRRFIAFLNAINILLNAIQNFLDAMQEFLGAITEPKLDAIQDFLDAMQEPQTTTRQCL